MKPFRKKKVMRLTARRGMDAADRAFLQARQIGDLFVELVGLKPARADRAAAVKTIAARFNLTPDKVNARLYLLRGAKAEWKAGRAGK